MNRYSGRRGISIPLLAFNLMIVATVIVFMLWLVGRAIDQAVGDKRVPTTPYSGTGGTFTVTAPRRLAQRKRSTA